MTAVSTRTRVASGALGKSPRVDFGVDVQNADGSAGSYRAQLEDLVDGVVAKAAGTTSGTFAAGDDARFATLAEGITTAEQAATSAGAAATSAGSSATAAANAAATAETHAESAATAAAGALQPSAIGRVGGVLGIDTNGHSNPMVLPAGATTARSAAEMGSDEINVLNYGARGDAVGYVTTADCPAGSDTLTFAAGAAISVGQAIAGPWIPAATVTAVATSGTNMTVTMSAPIPAASGTTVPDCPSGSTVYFGTADDAAFAAAQGAAASFGGRKILIPGDRTYLLNSLLYVISDDVLEFGPRALLVGNGGVQGLEDFSAANGGTLARATSARGDTATHAFYLLSNPSGDTSNHQRNVVYVRGVQAEDSTYDASGNIINFYDLVGVESQVGLATGITAGRVFGYHASVSTPPTSDGQLIGAEIEVYNQQKKIQTVAGTGTSKTGVHIDSNLGTSTSGIHISGGGTWISGIDFDRGAIYGSGTYTDASGNTVTVAAGYAYRFFDRDQTIWASLGYDGTSYARRVTTDKEALTGGGAIQIGKATDAATYLPQLAMHFPSAAATDAATFTIVQPDAAHVDLVLGSTIVISADTGGLTVPGIYSPNGNVGSKTLEVFSDARVDGNILLGGKLYLDQSETTWVEESGGKIVIGTGGTSLFSIDAAGNVVAKGTITQSGTP